MVGYIKALRLPMCMFAGALTLLSFQLVTGNTNNAWLPALTVFLIACSTMVWNDYRDRFHDLRKGKDFAYRHERAFLIYALSLWLLSISLSVLLGIHQNFKFTALTLGMVFAGLIYSETRRISFAPNTIVALTSASSVLFPAFIGFDKSADLWFLFFGSFLGIYSREIAKDFDDIQIDKTYKWTLLQLLGPETAFEVMVVLLAIAASLTTFLGDFGQPTFASIIIMYLFFLPNKMKDTLELTTYAKAAKWSFDIGIFFLITSLFICPIP